MIMMRKCRRVKCGVIFVLALMLLCEVCMSMCMRVAARHIYHYFVAIIINIITSSSSLSSTSHLYIVALFGITEQCANICVYVQKK